MAKVNILFNFVLFLNSISQRNFLVFLLGVSDQERMDSCRHDSVAANSIYQERNSTSETHKFAALGIKPSETGKAVTPDPATPSPTAPNKKLHYYEISLTPPDTKIKSSPLADISLSQPTNYSLPLPTDYSLTQEALSVVKNEITNVRDSFTPVLSSRHQAVLKMGQEVQELKREVVFLRESLHNSISHQELLKRRIFHFEQREEAELIRHSREFEEEKEAYHTKKYSDSYPPRTYTSNRNVSAHFNRK